MNRIEDRGQPMMDRFLKRVKKTNQCWIWIGNVMMSGYGTLGSVRAHRLSWVLHRGPIPLGLFVCHHCDNPRCVNPDHLFLGTQKDNMADANRKGRVINPNPERGEDRKLAKLNDQSVRKIRALYSSGEFSQQSLASRFGVSQSVIRDVVLLRGWKHVV